MSEGVAIVIPTFNEKHNIETLIKKIQIVAKAFEYEIIFVDDDSMDGTGEEIERVAGNNPKIRLLRRIGRRGLSSACVEGMLATNKDCIIVMDADLQHDESVITEIYDYFQKSSDTDLIIASRFLKHSEIDKSFNSRLIYSNLGNKISRLILGKQITDPLSGFFGLRKTLIKKFIYNISGRGFKILFDILSAAPDVNVHEIPFHFKKRISGGSKLDLRIKIEFLLLIIDKILPAAIPLEFIIFITMGSIGAIFHMSILYTSMKIYAFDFLFSQLMASFSAMTVNFILNNMFTYSQYRLKGLEFIKGLFSFNLICSFGLFINLSTAYYLFEHTVPWYVAGIIGAAFGSVWNFAVTRALTWRIFTRKSSIQTA